MHAPERLLGALVRHPEGLVTAQAASATGGGLERARTQLAERGHVLREVEGRLVLDCARLHFDPVAFESARRGNLGADLEVWERATSTNDLARAAARAGGPGGALWLAEEQTSGRGRQGRAWVCAPHAGLLVSVLLRSRLDAESTPTLLPLALALGACEGAREATGLEVRPKWPNDLWLEGRKVGGMLVEISRGAAAHVVAGLGLNVTPRATAGTDDLPLATALFAEGQPAPARETLLACILAGLERRLQAWSERRFETLRADWERADLVVGRRVRLQYGNEVLEGRALGVTHAGLLRLDAGAGAARELAAGEVHLL